jgi:WD40 repeat protein
VTAADFEVHIRRVDTGALLRVLGGHEALVFTVAISPDGKQLASASNDGTVRLWEVETGKVSRVLRGPPCERTLSYSPDGRSLASGCHDRVVRIWDTEKGTLVRELAHGSPVWSVSYLPDGKTIASGGEDHSIRLWDVATGTQRQTLGGTIGLIFSLVPSPDGRTLASGSNDGTIRLWDLASGQSRVLRLGHVPFWMAFHPNGRELVSSDGLGIATYLSDLVSGKSVRLEAGGRIKQYGVAISPDGKKVAIATSDGYALLDKETGKPVWRAIALFRDPVRLLTHRGWRRLEKSAKKPPATPAWQASVERAYSASESDTKGSALLCIELPGDKLEIWDKARSKQLKTVDVPQLATVLASPGGCVTLQKDGQVRRYRPNGSSETLIKSGATSLDVDRGVVLAAGADRKAHVFPARGAPRTVEVRALVDAMVRWKRALVVAYQNRRFELVSRGSRIPLDLEGIPPARVQLMRLGPKDTLVAGFANGMVGIWDLETRRLLDQVRLHGSVSHLLIEEDKLYAATSIGNHAVVDLKVLVVDRCTLLREVWRKVPMVWEGGKPVPRKPPDNHPCTEKQLASPGASGS